MDLRRVNLVGSPGARAYASAYLCFGLIAIVLFAFVVPPYQSPDEPAHVRRADQISRGELLAYRLDGAASGGLISRGIDRTSGIFVPLQLDPAGKITPQMRAEAQDVTWENSGVAPQIFSNTALYPPALYLPSVVSILAGKLANLTIVSTLRLARLANGIVSVAIGALAIALAGAGAPWMFALLSLPMSLFLMSSVTHDGPMIALAALAAAILFNSYPGGSLAGSRRSFAAMCAAIALVASARPTYAPLAVLPLLASGHRWAVRLAGVTVIVAIVLVWSRIVAPLVLFQIAQEADPSAQWALLRADPLGFLGVIWRTVSFTGWHLLETFVGRLGWLDTHLPRGYHVFARVELLVAAFATVAALAVTRFSPRALVAAAAIVAGSVAVFLSLYVVWTKPGEIYVVGVQGRYLIPLALFLPAALPFGAGAVPPAVARVAFMTLLAFPPVSIAIAIVAVVQRYYA